MKKEFIEKVIRLGSVDTDKYRYVAREYPDRLEVQRLPLSALDTTWRWTDGRLWRWSSETQI